MVKQCYQMSMLHQIFYSIIILHLLANVHWLSSKIITLHFPEKYLHFPFLTSKSFVNWIVKSSKKIKQKRERKKERERIFKIYSTLCASDSFFHLLILANPCCGPFSQGPKQARFRNRKIQIDCLGSNMAKFNTY